MSNEIVIWQHLHHHQHLNDSYNMLWWCISIEQQRKFCSWINTQTIFFTVWKTWHLPPVLHSTVSQITSCCHSMMCLYFNIDQLKNSSVNDKKWFCIKPSVVKPCNQHSSEASLSSRPELRSDPYQGKSIGYCVNEHTEAEWMIQYQQGKYLWWFCCCECRLYLIWLGGRK